MVPFVGLQQDKWRQAQVPVELDQFYPFYALKAICPYFPAESMLTPNLHHQLLSLNSFRFNCALTKGKSCVPILLNRFALVSTKAPDIDRWKYRSKCISSGSGSGPQARSGRQLLDNGLQNCDHKFAMGTTSLQWAFTCLQWAPLTCNGHHAEACNAGTRRTAKSGLARCSGGVTAVIKWTLERRHLMPRCPPSFKISNWKKTSFNQNA